MRVAVVTGAGRGIGRAVATRLAEAGYRVACVDRDEAGATATAALSGGTSHVCDVGDRAAVGELADALGPVEALVCNAGIWRHAPLDAMTEPDVEDVVATNLLGSLWCVQAFAPGMRRLGHGAIVLLSSAAATTRSPGTGIYPSTKAAIEALTGQLALELGPAGIRVNAVAPGLILTEGTAAAYGREGPASDRLTRAVPLRRLGEPADVAAVVAFLLSESASYLTGEVVHVDGGLTAGLDAHR